MRHTKIVATLGPATDTEEAIEALVDAGVDVFRLNFSHGTHEAHQAAFARVRRAADRAGRTVAIMQDLGGPKIRTGQLDGGRAIPVPRGSELRIATGDFAASPEGLVARADLADALQTRTAANQDPHAAAQIGVSFRSGDGTVCRTFVAGGNAGIACRGSSAWRVIALAPVAHGEARGDYRMAAAALPDAIRDTATAMMAGAPLTQRQEAEAIKSGWRRE